jgi:hypothetical protein
MAAAEARRLPMLDHALGFLKLGYPIFPVCSPLMGKHQHVSQWCTSPGKRPMVAWEPYQTRLPTEAEVRRWWTAEPRCNIGMATGALSGVIVLDCDSGEANKLAMSKGGLDRTPAVWTGKPGGVHYWLAHPGEEVRNFARRLPGTDLRGDGGYVLLPPSRHASGADYRWNEHTLGMSPSPIPEWLWELLRSSGSAASGSDEGRDPLDVEAILNGIGEGARDDTLWRYAGKMRGDDVPQAYAEQMIRQAARLCRPPFDEDLAIGMIRRAYKEYQPRVERDFSEWFEDEAEAAASEESQAKAAPPESRYPIQSLADLILLSDEHPEQIVDGLIWPNRVTWAFADPNSGKTLFLLAALMHVAAGRPFCGHAVKQMPVLIIEEDSPLSVVAEYIVMLTEIYEFDVSTLPIWINKIQGLRIVGDDGSVVVHDAIDACPQRPGVVMFDACERIVPSDRFNTKELDPFTRTLQRLIGERITPIVIDHTNRAKAEKGKEEQFQANPMERLFGARAKSAISDVMLYFDGFLKHGPVELVFAKFRGETPPKMTLRFDGATGFSIVDPPHVAQNENERLVIRFFNNAGSGEYSVSDVEAGVPLKRRTLERVLSILTKRRWLTATGSTTARRYRLAPQGDGLWP